MHLQQVGTRVGDHTRAECLRVHLEHLQAGGEWSREDQVVPSDVLRVQLADARIELLPFARQRHLIAWLADAGCQLVCRFVELASSN